MKGKEKRNPAGMIVLLCALLLMCTACGDSRQENISGQDGFEAADYVYVPEFTEIDFPENCNIYNPKFVGNSLYYIAELFGEGDTPNRRILYEYSLTEEKNMREILVCEGLGNTYDFWVTGDGWVYVNDAPFYGMVSEDGRYADGDSLFQLLVFDAQGSLSLTINLQELGLRTQWAPLVDGERRIYLPFGDSVAMFAADGTYQGEVKLEGDIAAAGMSPDGDVYVSCYGEGSEQILSRIDYEAKEVVSFSENFPVSWSYFFFVGADHDFLIDGGSRLLGYNLETQTYEEILRWMDCDMNSAAVRAFGQTEEGDFMALFGGGNAGARELVRLTKRDVATLPEKTELVVGTVWADAELEQVVSDFNLRSTDIHVTIKDYSEAAANDRDPYTALSLDLVSAEDSPDILNLSGLDIESLAANGVFENLSPYLEQSLVLNREDYLESILNSYTCGDILVSIPLSVRLDTFAASTSAVGELTGWTLEELLDCAKVHPEMRLYGPFLSDNVKESVLNNCLQFTQETFVDRTEGVCSFDSDEFKRFLRFVDTFPDLEDINSVSESVSTPLLAQNGEVLLISITLSSFYDIQLYRAMYGGEDAGLFIGYPTADGSGCSAFLTSNAYAIAAGSKNKEAAWSFIEMYLCQEVNDSYHLPTNKRALLEKAGAVEYSIDSEGQYWLDLNGRPMPRYTTVRYDGWSYEYHPVTEEETAMMLHLLETARRKTSMDSTIYDIISEEAEIFFRGQATVDRAAAAIQNRVQLYLQENK